MWLIFWNFLLLIMGLRQIQSSASALPISAIEFDITLTSKDRLLLDGLCILRLQVLRAAHKRCLRRLPGEFHVCQSQTQAIYHGGPRTFCVRWDSDGILEAKCSGSHKKENISHSVNHFTLVHFLPFFFFLSSYANDKMRDRQRGGSDR